MNNGDLQLEPVSIAAAKAFVSKRHRHHRAPAGSKFALCATLGGVIVGVVMVGRPVARAEDDGETAEVVRLCSDGTPNACSFLLARAKRAAHAMGYRRVLTRTLVNENGASLRGAGWKLLRLTEGRSWSTPSRPRKIDAHNAIGKMVWAGGGK